MANTYAQCYNHIVFSTKNRANLIHRDIEQRIWAYLGGIARNNNMAAIIIGGIENHIHALVSSPAVMSPSKIAQLLKGNSSHWIHAEFDHLNTFAWQDGFGVFSVSRSQVDKVALYIEGQREHHQNESFEDEFVRLLDVHEIKYDPRYLFG